MFSVWGYYKYSCLGSLSSCILTPWVWLELILPFGSGWTRDQGPLDKIILCPGHSDACRTVCVAHNGQLELISGDLLEPLGLYPYSQICYIDKYTQSFWASAIK